ncbi:hemopexin repeat-containing protein [Protofrankia coriariae]|uniref:hemopexin repeat-containing protein n=1 Tax=Protofrankia coriariae TaxID=1562887 RepID=UPI0006999735|nr:hemopexin repeat-containing protein [Protofrankia coriariae]
MSKAYVTRGGRYLRYDVDGDAADAGYPKALTDGWSGLSGTGFETGIDAALDLGTGKVYLFRGPNYLRIDQQRNQVDEEPRPIAGAWAGLAEAGFADGVDAAINWGNGKAYFFRGDSYVQYDIGADRVDDGYPQPIAQDWPGFADAGFADGVDAAINWGNGKAYFFRGDSYLRYSIGVGTDEGYPRPIAGNWPGLGEAGFSDGLDAIWVKLTSAPAPGPGPAPSGVGLVPGDHVWYYNGQISTDRDIPRAVWFPGSQSPTDYLGHGDEIFNFVIHADAIYRGRPHMRGREGTYAWLNNNPGNITGVPGGTDYGQYRDKFNWHRFIIFPTRQAGYDAIAAFLRQASYPAKTTGVRQWPAGRYRDLGITEAFHRYAPAEDGNDPDSYGAAVAAAAGVSTTTLISELTDAQMAHMQNKIAEIEGAVPGVIFAPDSADLPDAVRAALA